MTNLCDRKMTAFVHLRVTEDRGFSSDFWSVINHTTKKLPLRNLSSSYIWDLKGRHGGFAALENNNNNNHDNKKTLECINMGFLRGLVDAAWMDQDTHRYTPRYFFFHSIFISTVLVVHHEINDLPVDWSEAVFFFLFFVPCLFVTVCLYSCECMCTTCMCKSSFTYAFGCLCLHMCVWSVQFCVNESLCSQHRGGLRMPG